MYRGVHLTSHVLQGTRTTQRCLTGHSVGGRDICISSPTDIYAMKIILEIDQNSCKQTEILQWQSTFPPTDIYAIMTNLQELLQ